jgi:hypothetical protein
MSTQPRTNPTTIETLADAVYPSFAMLAGMELDLFTPLKDGPLTAEEIARAAGTDRAKTAPLLHALVAIGLLKSDGDFVSENVRIGKKTGSRICRVD